MKILHDNIAKYWKCAKLVLITIGTFCCYKIKATDSLSYVCSIEILWPASLLRHATLKFAVKYIGAPVKFLKVMLHRLSWLEWRGILFYLFSKLVSRKVLGVNISAKQARPLLLSFNFVITASAWSKLLWIKFTVKSFLLLMTAKSCNLSARSAGACKNLVYQLVAFRRKKNCTASNADTRILRLFYSILMITNCGTKTFDVRFYPILYVQEIHLNLSVHYNVWCYLWCWIRHCDCSLSWT